MAKQVQDQNGNWITVTEGDDDRVRQGDKTLRWDPYTRRYKEV